MGTSSDSKPHSRAFDFTRCNSDRADCSKTSAHVGVATSLTQTHIPIPGVQSVDSPENEVQKCSPQNRIEGGPHGGCPTLDARAVAERKSVRSLLARPFYWLGLVSVVFLLIFLWSAEHVEGVSANDLVETVAERLEPRIAALRRDAIGPRAQQAFPHGYKSTNVSKFSSGSGRRRWRLSGMLGSKRQQARKPLRLPASASALGVRTFIFNLPLGSMRVWLDPD